MSVEGMDFPSVSDLFFFQELSSIVGSEASAQWLCKQCEASNSSKSASGKSTPVRQLSRMPYQANGSRSPSTEGVHAASNADNYLLYSSNRASEVRLNRKDMRTAPHIQNASAIRSSSTSNVFRPKEPWHQIRAMSKSCNAANMGLLFTDAAHTVLE